MASPNIALIGGHSTLAAELRAGFFPEALGIVRAAPGRFERAISEYCAIEPYHLEGIDVAINCAGAVSGSSDDLRRANSDLPRLLAASCKAAGVKTLIHVSSFSVHGDATCINRSTPECPTNEYGHSKLAGDRALLDAVSGAFSAVALRLPAIISPAYERSKVADLIRIWRRFRAFPVPRGDVRRTMISSYLTAKTIAGIVADAKESGIYYAGDPTPFTYRAACKQISLGSGTKVLALTVPAAAIGLVSWVAPGVHKRVFRDSVLDRSINICADTDSDLMQTIKNMASRK